jgi:hypothetical protein
MIFDDGGEEGSVGQMVEESKHFQTRCKYVTVIIYFSYPFDLSNNNFYKMVHLDAREDVICGYYCRKLP